MQFIRYLRFQRRQVIADGHGVTSASRSSGRWSAALMRCQVLVYGSLGLFQGRYSLGTMPTAFSRPLAPGSFSLHWWWYPHGAMPATGRSASSCLSFAESLPIRGPVRFVGVLWWWYPLGAMPATVLSAPSCLELCGVSSHLPSGFVRRRAWWWYPLGAMPATVRSAPSCLSFANLFPPLSVWLVAGRSSGRHVTDR